MSDYDPLDPSPDDLWERTIEEGRAQRELGQESYEDWASQQFEEYVRDQLKEGDEA